MVIDELVEVTLIDGGGGFGFDGGLSLATFPPPASWGSAGPLALWQVEP